MVGIKGERTTLFVCECNWVCMCGEREREREIWKAYWYEIFMSHVKVLKCKNLFVQTFFLLRSALENCFTSLKSFHDFRQLCCFVSISKYDRMKYCKYSFFVKRSYWQLIICYVKYFNRNMVINFIVVALYIKI